MWLHELPEHVAGIRRVHLAAFPSEVEADLVEELRSHGHLHPSIVYVEGEDRTSRIAGHAAFSPVTVDAVSTTHSGVGLGPVAVMPDRQGQGIGAELIEAGLQVCRDLGVGFAVVLGDPAYYRRFGFRTAAEFHLHDAFAGGAAFMALELTSGALTETEGLVRYSKEFNRFL